MRALRASFLLFVALAAASAADLKVKVIDPHSAVVAGAQVLLTSKCTGTSVAVVTSSALGVATFAGLRIADLPSGKCPLHLQVLAPGFASQIEDVATHSDVITIQLRLAPASETVVVTATRTPVEASSAGADVATLNREQLQIMNPVAADDASGSPGFVVEVEPSAGTEEKGSQEVAIVAMMAASSPSSSPDSARRSSTSTLMAARSLFASTTLFCRSRRRVSRSLDRSRSASARTVPPLSLASFFARVISASASASV